MRHGRVISRQREALLDLIYSAISDLGHWPEVLTRVADHLGAVGGMLMHIPPAGQGPAVPAESTALARALAQALAVAAGTGDTLGEPLRLTRPSGAPPLLVLPVPLPPPAFELWNLLEPARVLVLVIDPAAQRRRKPSTVQAALGLTPAEARVAILVADGLTGPQVAAALGISASTVKTHLKRCFDKIGVHSQVDLARLLTTFPIDPTGRWN